jgi:quinol monooxygenase YgiN
MRSAAIVLFTFLIMSSAGFPSLRAQAPAEAAVYAVTYVEVMASGSGAMASAFKQYREASRKEDGFVRFDLREQVGRPGLFTVVEAWRDQKAADAHAAAAHTMQYREALRPIRVSGYDQRPYKPLSVGAVRDGSGQVHVVSHVDIGQGGSATPVDAPALLRRLAETSRTEPGNLRFEVLQHMMRANHFTVIEVWRDQKAIDAHRAAAHTKDYRDVLQPISGSPLDERWYKGVE